MDVETPIDPEEAMPSRQEDPKAGESVGDEPGRPETPDLRSALRIARIEGAERSRAIADVRGAEIARLDLLREAIEPVLAQIPADVDMFDAGLLPLPHPRLFIDMIAFVEMAPDKRTYRFVQETRHGRVQLAQGERLEAMRDAVTAYIAHRLVEREKALAGDTAFALPATESAEMTGARKAAAAYAARTRFRWLRTVPNLILNYLGIVALCVLVWVLGGALYRYAVTLRW